MSGSITGMAGGRVLVLAAQGTGWTGAVRGHSFTVVIPVHDRARLLDATVQVVGASGRYVGPVVLKKLAEAENPACGRSTRPACIDDVVGLGKNTGNVALGLLKGENVADGSPTWFLASKAPSIDVRDAVRARSHNGRPYGAGNLGLVPGGIPTASVHARRSASGHLVSGRAAAAGVLAAAPGGGKWVPLPRSGEETTGSSSRAAHAGRSGARAPAGADAASGTVSEACPTTNDPLDSTVATSGTIAGTDPGQELDCSGIPNVVNADVNGNDVLNLSDPSAASIAASTITIGAKVHAGESSAISYYAPGGISTSALSTFLDPVDPAIGDNAIFTFAAWSGQLFPGDDGGDVTMSADCGAVAWCENALLFDDADGTVDGPWSKASPPFAFEPNAKTAKAGGFSAMVLAPLGTSVTSEIVPGQLIGVEGTQQSSGSTVESMMAVGPYFASTPYVQGATWSGPPPASPNLMLTDSAGDSVRDVGSGTVTVKVERPERLPLPGETSSSGVMDMSGLDYDVSVSPDTTSTSSTPTANCPASSFSDVSGATAQSVDNFAGFALVDDTTEDFDPASATNPGPIEFTFDPSACAASGGVAWTAGQEYAINIDASGVEGDDQTGENFNIKA